MPVLQMMYIHGGGSLILLIDRPRYPDFVPHISCAQSIYVTGVCVTSLPLTINPLSLLSTSHANQ